MQPRTENIVEQIITITQLSDTLLLKLMNGELRVHVY